MKRFSKNGIIVRRGPQVHPVERTRCLTRVSTPLCPGATQTPNLFKLGKRGLWRARWVTATVPVVAGGSAKVPRRRRGPAKGGVKQKGTKSGGMPRGISKSRFYDSDSSEPHIPTSRSEEEADTPACQEGPGGWLEGPRDAPDGFVHTCRLCRCKDCCAAIAGWILRC